MQNGEEARLEIDSKEGELSRESSEEDCCRICHNSQQYANDLVSPCNCSGSLGKMHISCLSQWLQLSKRQKCELCGYKYTFARESLKFIDFLRDPELRRTHRQLFFVSIFFLIRLKFLHFFGRLNTKILFLSLSLSQVLSLFFKYPMISPSMNCIPSKS
ncbi:MARCH3 [Acanthosepion pharaonis]|uniref:MARCH3 n=1 Tax=Acanthosepion pharaonis TaxID=158019 RepID=A0A812CCQ9_ACAPH|nr:MARCH3 [Sepia pharaonis]